MRKRHKLGAWAILFAAQMTLPAFAELADTAYFNLWTRAAANRAQGGGDRLIPCGRRDAMLCNGAFDATRDNTIDRGNAIFAAYKKTAGKGSGAVEPFQHFQRNKGSVTRKSTTKAAFNSRNTNIRTTTSSNVPRRQLKVRDLLVDDDRYYTFRLDINERGGRKSQLRLDELQFFVAGTPPVNHVQTKRGAKALATHDSDGYRAGKQLRKRDPPLLDLVDSINDTGPAGSGDNDMADRLHSWLFTTAAAGFGDNAYVYLYKFVGEADSNEDPGEAEAGIDELAAVTNPALVTLPALNGIPEPGTALLLVAGLVGLVRKGRATS